MSHFNFEFLFVPVMSFVVYRITLKVYETVFIVYYLQYIHTIH